MPVERQIDHQYIEANRIPERYLGRTLAADEQRRFEEHFADCPECLDRLALAEVFLNSAREKRTMPARQAPVTVSAPVPGSGMAASFLRLSRRRQMAALGIAVLLLVGSPAAFFGGFTAGLWSRWNEEAVRARTGLLSDVPVLKGAQYSIAVTDAAGKLVWAQGGIEGREGQSLMIPFSFERLPPGDFEVSVRMRLAGSANPVVATYRIRKPGL